MTKKFEDFILWRGLVMLIRIILVVSSLAAMLTIVYGVLKRYVFHSDLYGIEELLTLFSMWLYFIGGVHGSYEDSHINADVIGSNLKSPKAKRILRIIVTSICLICSIFLAKWGWEYLLWCLKIGGNTVSLHMPLILSRLPLSLCFFLMVLYNIYHFVNAILGRNPVEDRKTQEIETEGGETA